MSASFLHEIELCSIGCKILVQEKTVQGSMTHVQVSLQVDLYKILDFVSPA